MAANIIKHYKITPSLLGMIFIVFIVAGCKNSRLSRFSEMEGAYIGTIGVSAGDVIDYINSDTLNFMAFPMNVATMTTKKGIEKTIFIVGSAIKKEQIVAFKPVALLRYYNADKTENFIVIAKPLDNQLVTADINTYFELISVHYGVQKIIETWVKNAKGYGSVTELFWENEIKAQEYLDY